MGMPPPSSGMMKIGFSPEQAQYRTSALSIMGGGATIRLRRSIISFDASIVREVKNCRQCVRQLDLKRRQNQVNGPPDAQKGGGMSNSGESVQRQEEVRKA
jgi:hypothetical protein